MRVSVTLFCTFTDPEGSFRYILERPRSVFSTPRFPIYMVASASVAIFLFSKYLCDSGILYYAFSFYRSFFLVHLSFLSPYIESIWSSFSFVFSDVFASPMWAELNNVKAPSLRCLVEKLLEIVLGSRADSTTLTYLNGFKRWRAWANRFPEVIVLPATPVYVYLLTCSVFFRLHGSRFRHLPKVGTTICSAIFKQLR